MVKECDLINLVEKYLNEKRLDCIDALYLWSHFVSPSNIAKTLRIRYGSGGVYSIIISDLNAMKRRNGSRAYHDMRKFYLELNRISRNNEKCIVRPGILQ